MLAVAVVHDSTAGRLIDNARVALGEDPESLALALASNIPAQTERARPKTRRRRVKPRAAGHAGRRRRQGRTRRAGAARPRRSSRTSRSPPSEPAGEATPLTQPGDAPPSRSKRRRRRRRKRRDAEVATTGEATTPDDTVDEADTRLAAG